MTRSVTMQLTLSVTEDSDLMVSLAFAKLLRQFGDRDEVVMGQLPIGEEVVEQHPILTETITLKYKIEQVVT